MKKIPTDYTAMTAHAKNCGLVPHLNRDGSVKEGFYTLEGKHAPIDLSACALDEKSILRTALQQLSEQADEQYHAGIEQNLMN